MPQRPVPPGPGRDGDPGRDEGDWLAWCEALAVSGQPLGPDDEEEPGEDAAPWDADLAGILRTAAYDVNAAFMQLEQHDWDIHAV